MAGDSGKGYAAVYLFGLLNGNVFPPVTYISYRDICLSSCVFRSGDG